MRKSYKINGQSITIPTNWQEVTLSELIIMSESKDEFDLLSGFLHLPKEKIKNANANAFDEILLDLSFIQRKINLELLPLPEKITIADKEYPAPKGNLEILFTFAQKIEVDQIVQNYSYTEGEGDEMKAYCKAYKAIPEILAVYYYPIITGKDFDNIEYKQIIDDIMACNMIEAYPLGNFFFRIASAFKRNGAESYNLTDAYKAHNTTLKPNRIHSMLLACLQRSIRWQAETLQNMSRSIMKN